MEYSIKKETLIGLLESDLKINQWEANTPEEALRQLLLNKELKRTLNE